MMRAALSALVLAACNSGESQVGRACGPNGECPSGFTCSPATLQP